MNEVITVGESTRGKLVGSLTFYLLYSLPRFVSFFFGLFSFFSSVCWYVVFGLFSFSVVFAWYVVVFVWLSFLL